MKTDRTQEIRQIKSEANTPKRRLMELKSRLEESGAIREANSLGTIIWKLEAWQNK